MEGGNDVRGMPTSDGQPAARSAQGDTHHPEEGALLMLLPQGGRVDNGWWMGDELCHQTRGLKDGLLECYQSCLDQDVRLSRSFPSFSSLPPAPLVVPRPCCPSPGSPSSLPGWLYALLLLFFPLLLLFFTPPLQLFFNSFVLTFPFFLLSLLSPFYPSFPPSLLLILHLLDLSSLVLPPSFPLLGLSSSSLSCVSSLSCLVFFSHPRPIFLSLSRPCLLQHYVAKILISN